MRFLDGGKILNNHRLTDDYFFNRSTIEKCSNRLEALSMLQTFCNERDIGCSLYQRQFNAELQGLQLRDRMSVLVSTAATSLEKNRREEFEFLNAWSEPGLVAAWVNVFCRSFDVLGWEATVNTRVAKKQFRSVDLVLGLLRKKPIACVAVYKTAHHSGVYCLGVLPEFRRIGAASATLSYLARKYGGLYLQSLDAEGSLDLYEHCGFSVVYTKSIYYVKQHKSQDRN